MGIEQSEVSDALLGGTSTSRPSMKERQWQLRENAILDAAAELLNAKGFNAMTLEDITEAIGISRPTLYLHFKSKEDVIVNLVIRSLEDLRRLAEDPYPGLTPGQRLRKFMTQILDYRFDKSRIAMLDLTRIKLTHAGNSPELRDCECNFNVQVSALIKAAQATGEARTEISPEMMVVVLAGYLKNLEIDTLIEEGKTTRAEIEETAMRIIFPEG